VILPDLEEAKVEGLDKGCGEGMLELIESGRHAKKEGYRETAECREITVDEIGDEGGLEGFCILECNYNTKVFKRLRSNALAGGST